MGKRLFKKAWEERQLLKTKTGRVKCSVKKKRKVFTKSTPRPSHTLLELAAAKGVMADMPPSNVGILGISEDCARIVNCSFKGFDK
jgi:hypothetical protein